MHIGSWDGKNQTKKNNMGNESTRKPTQDGLAWNGLGVDRNRNTYEHRLCDLVQIKSQRVLV